MRFPSFFALLGAGLLAAATAAAQDKKPTAADDEVFDNTKLKQELAQKRAKERREKYQGDSPFAADQKPDKVENRELHFVPGLWGGYRAGWGFPGGNIWKDTKFTERLVGMIFVQGDGGYRPIPELLLGIYLSGGYVLPDCEEDRSCSNWDFRAGIQAQWRFMPFADFTPWVGLGTGWELLFESETDPLDHTTSVTLHGPELFNLQGGIDIWAPTARGHAGLFVSYAMGRFISTSASYDGDDIGFDPDKANHSWIFVGARGTF